MAKLNGVSKSRSSNIYRSGITRAEVFERTDKLRQEVLAIITARGATPVRVIATQMGISYDAARNYGGYLVSIEAATKFKVGLDTYFEVTGKPYYNQKRATGVKKVTDTEKEAAPVNPYLRVIKLMDRDPKDISKDEHNTNRRSVRASIRGSSMAMFDL